jgi:hypothetical protein
MPAQRAYVMLGHGNEIVNKSTKNIVPPGCTLVVEVHSGELNFKDFNKIIDYNNKKIFLDPINNYKELVDSFSSINKSFAIYGEGSEYPDFSYSLLSQHEKNSDSLILEDSGVISYPFQRINTNHIIPKNKTYNYNDSSEKLIDKYRMSIYPSKQQITKFIVNNKLNTLNDIFNNKFYYSEFRKMVGVTQSQLFKILPPGVFYNFICRATYKNTVTNADIIISHKGIEEKIIQFPIFKDNLRKPLIRRKRGDKYFIPEIINQISEAEIHRKPYISKLELNKSDYISPQKIKIREKIKELQKYIKQYEDNTEFYENKIIQLNNNINILVDRKKYAKSDKDINLINNDITFFNERIKSSKDTIINNNRYISVVNEKIKGLESLLNDSLINTSTSDYVWKKIDKKWRKVTIKNRNNQGVLPEGWKVYSNGTRRWYISPSGSSTWNRPNLTTAKNRNNKSMVPVEKVTIKNRNNKGVLPEGWKVYYNGDKRWYRSPSGSATWNRPIVEDPRPPIVNNSDSEVNNPTENNPRKLDIKRYEFAVKASKKMDQQAKKRVVPLSYYPLENTVVNEKENKDNITNLILSKNF